MRNGGGGVACDAFSEPGQILQKALVMRAESGRIGACSVSLLSAWWLLSAPFKKINGADSGSCDWLEIDFQDFNRDLRAVRFS